MPALNMVSTTPQLLSTRVRRNRDKNRGNFMVARFSMLWKFKDRTKYGEREMASLEKYYVQWGDKALRTGGTI